MLNAQEIWTVMILSAYAKKFGIAISEASEHLLSDGGLNYLEDRYGALHTRSNDAVVDELIDIVIIQKIEDLETGYYLEGSAYLEEVFQIS